MVSDITDKKNNHRGAWITIGSFDGVHIGHQQIIQTLIDGAKTDDTFAVVLTFFPHPAKVLKHFDDPFYLSLPEEKNEILAGLGVDSVLTIHFDKDLAGLHAYEFMKIIHDQLKFSCLLIGYDFRLGANREGDIQKLREIGNNLGYCIKAIEPLQSGTQVVSSSMIRKLIITGEIAEANSKMGRNYSISGKIVHGDGRGKHIGIPTANIHTWSEKLIPGNGVYATLASIDGSILPSVVNIGSRPTFYSSKGQQTIEVHLLDFDRDIYGAELKLNFIQRIRNEIRFSSAEMLMEQIKIDIIETREVLEHASSEKNIPA